jgi:hypothetical protein
MLTRQPMTGQKTHRDGIITEEIMRTKDFAKAFVFHLHWKGKLRKFIDGTGTFNIEQISPDACRFGKWLTSEEIKQQAPPSEIRELISLHNELHDIAKRVYDLKVSGNDYAARQEWEEIDRYSMELSRRLITLKIITDN